MARRYKQGRARTQEALLPPRVEDDVSESNLVRAIDAYVDTLDLGELGFTNANGDLAPGQLPFDPAALLKLYLYGFMLGPARLYTHFGSWGELCESIRKRPKNKRLKIIPTHFAP